MDATQLDENEILALAGLALHLASADGMLSAEEADELKHLGEEIGGADTFSRAITDAEGRFKTAQDALDFAAEIEREDARDFIHTVLTDLANSDDMHNAEADLLGRLRLMWGIRGR
ncbi:MAG: TerB family tellurite resistance protein [Alphaproteobacteria bacterium]|nr:TerB family tellurite resistance protein [Alphaproteobacteria bacterium]